MTINITVARDGSPARFGRAAADTTVSPRAADDTKRLMPQARPIHRDGFERGAARTATGEPALTTRTASDSVLPLTRAISSARMRAGRPWAIKPGFVGDEAKDISYDDRHRFVSDVVDEVARLGLGDALPEEVDYADEHIRTRGHMREFASSYFRRGKVGLTSRNEAFGNEEYRHHDILLSHTLDAVRRDVGKLRGEIRRFREDIEVPELGSDVMPAPRAAFSRALRMLDERGAQELSAYVYRFDNRLKPSDKDLLEGRGLVADAARSLLRGPQASTGQAKAVSPLLESARQQIAADTRSFYALLAGYGQQ